MEESRAKVWEAEKKVGVERIERCMRQGGEEEECGEGVVPG